MRPDNFDKVIVYIAKSLKDRQYTIRGTASLVLQGLDMNTEDIDILANKETALDCNNILDFYLTNTVEYRQSDKFKSYFGSFLINQIPIEVMGEWQIKDTKGIWSPPFDASIYINMQTSGTIIRVTPVTEELKAFALMGRWTAYHKIRREALKLGLIKEKPKIIKDVHPSKKRINQTSLF